MNQIEGRQAVSEALKAGFPIERILLDRTAHGRPIDRIKELAGKLRVPVETVDTISRVAKSRAHQGVIALFKEFHYLSLDELLAAADKTDGWPLFVMLDGVLDPQNFGSILRSADALGADGVIIREKRAVGVTPAVIKASAGAFATMPVARVTNLTTALQELKEAGLWAVGTDAAGRDLLWDGDFKRATVIVIGSEGKGLSRLVKENCDLLLRIPMSGQLNSLNAAVAAALFLAEAKRQRLL